jgi:hypothetical protein
VRNGYAALIGNEAGGILDISGNREMIERTGRQGMEGDVNFPP